MNTATLCSTQGSMNWNYHMEQLMNMWLILSLIISLTRFMTKGWDTEILEEIVDFRCDPDVAIPKGEKKIQMLMELSTR